MKTTAFTLVFNYKNAPLGSGGVAPLHVLAYRRGAIRRYIPTGVSVAEAEWSDRRKEVTGVRAHEVNRVLRGMLEELRNLDYQTINRGLELTAAMLDDFLGNRGATPGSFTDFFAAEIDPALRRGTRKEHQYTLNLLRRFRPQVRFEEVTPALISDFDRYLRQEAGLMQNTIYKHHQHINRFLRLAAMRQLFDDSKNPYRHFKTRKVRSNRTALAADELRRIEQLDTRGTDLEPIRLMFLFSCYCGLRFSDVVTLTPDHVKRGPDGLFIEKRMEKVSKPVVLPLAILFGGRALPILDHFMAQGGGGGPIFPQHSNQHVNRSLKLIAIAAGIHMNLTFHVARHTFGSRLADITQNPFLIMDLMGHEKIETSMIYIHRSQERINRQLRGVSWE